MAEPTARTDNPATGLPDEQTACSEPAPVAARPESRDPTVTADGVELPPASRAIWIGSGAEVEQIGRCCSDSIVFPY
ncbi:MAG: hypothetical protein QM756_45110 [Polyangiaceae bacterium]